MYDNDFDFEQEENDTLWIFVAAMIVVISILASLAFITPEPSTEREKACEEYSYNPAMMKALKCEELER